MPNNDSSNTDFKFDFGATETAAPSLNTKYSTVAQYIADMQAIESNIVPAATATQTKVMITKFRKIYYNSTGWNKILVPDTEDIPVLPASPANSAIAKSHEIALPDGETTDKQTQYLAYDAAHIFAILDAANHNGTLSPLSLLGSDLLAKLPSALKDIVPEVQDRLMASGWLGDLSEIIGEFYLQKATTTDAKQNLIDTFGAYYKNLANVDGMVMVQSYKDDLSATEGKKLSDIYVAYYGASGTGGERETLKATRYKTFAKMIGLTWKDSDFTNTETWVATQKTNLRTCAAFYIAETCLKKTSLVRETLKSSLKADISSALQNKTLSKHELQFAKFLNAEINKSTNSLDDDLSTLVICFLMWTGILDEDLSIDAVLKAFVAGLTKAINDTAATA